MLVDPNTCKDESGRHRKTLEMMFCYNNNRVLHLITFFFFPNEKYCFHSNDVRRTLRSTPVC